jgi:hypothetical protein
VRNPLPPVPLTLAFVNYINHGDLPGLVSLMSTDHEESLLTLIWVAECHNGAIGGWTLVEDTPLNRERYGLGAQEK